MLAEVFDIPYIPSNQVEPPEVFDPLRGIFRVRENAWRAINVDLLALEALPVRSGKSAPVRNHALEQALIACRAYWLKWSPARKWSRSSLPQIKKSIQIDQLQGPCERFVADMLTAAGIDFDLLTLNGAWSGLQKREQRQQSGESPKGRARRRSKVSPSGPA
jgi:hypothetical protein